MRDLLPDSKTIRTLLLGVAVGATLGMVYSDTTMVYHVTKDCSLMESTRIGDTVFDCKKRNIR
jgi:hypothetical protein